MNEDSIMNLINTINIINIIKKNTLVITLIFFLGCITLQGSDSKINLEEAERIYRAGYQAEQKNLFSESRNNYYSVCKQFLEQKETLTSSNLNELPFIFSR